MKKFSWIAIFATAMVLTMGFVSCNNEPKEEEPTTYTITYLGLPEGVENPNPETYTNKSKNITLLKQLPSKRAIQLRLLQAFILILQITPFLFGMTANQRRFITIRRKAKN